MAQTSILAPDVTQANSADVVIGQNEAALVGLYVTVGTIPQNAHFVIYQKTPGAAFPLAELKPRVPLVIAGQGTYYVARVLSGNLSGDATPVAVGVYKEYGA